MMTRFSFPHALMLFIVGLSLSFTASAEPTQIMVRAKALDAKYIGSSVGGVRVVIEDAETGEILDDGWIRGDTGDTDILIKNPIQRGQQLTNDTTAGYLATIDIDAPRLLRFQLIGPYGYRQALQQASVTSWVIPGKNILGDGITLTLPGFIVDAWTQVFENGDVEIYTKAALLCGCPIRHDGLWDPDSYEATAIIMQDGNKITETSLNFTGPVGLFSTKLALQPGIYKAIVYLIDQHRHYLFVDQ